MEIVTLIERARRRDLPPTQQKVLAFLEAHPGEVFSYRDEKLTQELGTKASAIGFSLWALHKAGLIGKETVAGKVYFGSHQAITELRRGLGIGRDEVFEQAVAHAEKIRARTGNVGGLDLLDEYRSHNS